jgi:hypothetical protein
MNLDRKTLIICFVCLCVGWWSAGGSKPDKPEPLDNRPILRWIAKTARTLLWVSLFVEPPPAPEPADNHLAHARTADGQPIVDHGKGW